MGTGRDRKLGFCRVLGEHNNITHYKHWTLRIGTPAHQTTMNSSMWCWFIFLQACSARSGPCSTAEEVLADRAARNRAASLSVRGCDVSRVIQFWHWHPLNRPSVNNVNIFFSNSNPISGGDKTEAPGCERVRLRERCGVVSAVVAVSATGDRSPSPGLAPCCSPPLNLGHHPGSRAGHGGPRGFRNHGEGPY